jgi:hypothetical protein
MAVKLTRVTHKIAIQLHLGAESCIIRSSRSRWPVRKLLDSTSCIRFSYRCIQNFVNILHSYHFIHKIKTVLLYCMCPAEQTSVVVGNHLILTRGDVISVLYVLLISSRARLVTYVRPISKWNAYILSVCISFTSYKYCLSASRAVIRNICKFVSREDSSVK